MKDLKYFKKKESQLKRAKDRTQKILRDFSKGKRTDEENWNLVHDLEYRIDDRIWNNWSEFKDWHWDNYGFNVY